jgi:hypothetical protein
VSDIVRAMAVPAQRSSVVGRLAPLALMPAAAFAVHQLRFWLAFGGSASAALQAQGHAYLRSAVPWAMALIAIALGVFLRALGRSFGGERSLVGHTASFAVLWLVSAICLVAIYVAQDLTEGLLVSGHPAGLPGILGAGGWWSIPAALAVGLVLASLFHGARWVLHEVASRRARCPTGPSPRKTRARAPRELLLARPAPLADGWSGRGPPR